MLSQQPNAFVRQRLLACREPVAGSKPVEVEPILACRAAGKQRFDGWRRTEHLETVPREHLRDAPRARNSW